MMRLAAAALLVLLVTLPLTVLATAPVTWLAVVALVVGGLGVVVLSVPVVTAAAALTLIAYTLALLMARPPVDPLTASGLGAICVLLLSLVHFASRAQGAALGPPVIISQIRHWLAIVILGVAAAVALTAGGSALSGLLGGAAPPLIVVAAVLGALLTMAGALALVTTQEEP